MSDHTTRILVCGFCCLFVILGAALIPYAGIQGDEALFTGPIFHLISKDLSIPVCHRLIPLMVMTYVGALKTLLYIAIFAAFRANVWSIRLPMVVVGAITIWIFYRLALRAAGHRAALLAVALLATDPMFLLTDTFDWGPVALEHLLLVTGCLFLARFGQSGAWRHPAAFHSGMSNSGFNLALGLFCFGLAMWNKAVFIWALVGVIFGGFVVFWPEIRRALNLSNLAVAAAAFLCGAAPLIVYNIRNHNVTWTANAGLETGRLHTNLRALRTTLDGSGLLGFLAAEEWADGAKAPSSRRGRAALWIRNHFGEHRRDGLVYAFGLALLAAPLWWPLRAARFSLVFLVAAWLAMEFTRDAGGAAHHTVLLWPFPHLFIAATIASLRSRTVVAVACVVLVTMNLLVVNQYLVQLERDGAQGGFTDAIYPLSGALCDPSCPRPGNPIYLMDWGLTTTLALLHQGRLTLRDGSEAFDTPVPDPVQRRNIEIMLSDPQALFVGHVPAREVIPGIGERLNQAALAAGLKKEVIRTIPDSNGHPVFEIYRFTR